MNRDVGTLSSDYKCLIKLVQMGRRIISKDLPFYISFSLKVGIEITIHNV